MLTLAYVDRHGTVSDRTVEPLAIVGDAPNWYLWGWCRLRDAPRAFRIDRIRAAVMLEEVAPDRGTDINTYFHVVQGRSILDNP